MGARESPLDQVTCQRRGPLIFAAEAQNSESLSAKAQSNSRLILRRRVGSQGLAHIFVSDKGGLIGHHWREARTAIDTVRLRVTRNHAEAKRNLPHVFSRLPGGFSRETRQKCLGTINRSASKSCQPSSSICKVADGCSKPSHATGR